MPATPQVSFCPAESPGFCSCRRGKWPLGDKPQPLCSGLSGADVLVSSCVTAWTRAVHRRPGMRARFPLLHPLEPRSSSSLLLFTPTQPLLPERGPECACECGKSWGSDLASASRERPSPPWCGSIAATSHHPIQDSGTQHGCGDGLGWDGLERQRRIWRRGCAWFNLPTRAKEGPFSLVAGRKQKQVVVRF